MIPSPTIEAIVLSYNRPDYLRLALESLQSQTRPAWRITVVDNPSPKSAEIARVVAGFPGVRLVQNLENSGYTGGMNRGLRGAEGDWVYLTEDDIVLGADVLELLAGHAESHPEAGLVGAVIVDHADPARTICAGGTYELGAIFRLNFHTPPAPHAGGPVTPQEVMFLPGNSMLARRQWLQDLGGFREEFFMYLEDLELCARVRANDRKVVVVPQARAKHIAFTKNDTGQINYHRLKNFTAVYLLHAPLSVLPVFFLRYVVVTTVRATLRPGGGAAAYWKALGWTLRNACRLLADRGNRRRQIHHP